MIHDTEQVKKAIESILGTARPWLDAEQTGLLLGATGHTMRRLARENRSPVMVRRIGGRWRFSRQDVLHLMGMDSAGSEQAS